MSYTVYMHITPSGKMYIGITGRNPLKRWGSNGSGYKGQAFSNAIKKYGWDNMEHKRRLPLGIRAELTKG